MIMIMVLPSRVLTGWIAPAIYAFWFRSCVFDLFNTEIIRFILFCICE